MTRSYSLRSVVLVLLVVLALVPVFLQYMSYGHARYSGLKQSAQKSVEVANVGMAVVCTYGASLWGGHFVWSKRHHWKSYTKDRCPRLTSRSSTQSGDSTTRRFRNNSSVVMINACLGEGMAANNLTSIVDVYTYFDMVMSCGSELVLQHPTAIVVWKLDYSMVSGGKEIEELIDFLIYKHIMEACGIIVLNSDHEVEGAVVRRLRQFACHLMLSSPDEVVERLVAFQRAGLGGYNRNTLRSRCQLLLYTRKYDPFCHPARALAHPLLITGLGGSGTHYIAQRLAAEGWRVRHEEVGQDGAVSWFYAANDRAVRLSYPYGALPEDHRTGVLYPRFGHVVHLLREPEAQIASFTAHSNKTYDFVVRTMQDVLPHLLHSDAPGVVQKFLKARAAQDHCFRGDGCHLHFAALSWLHWNRFVHRFADATFRVDQVEEIVQHVCRVVSAMESELPTAAAAGRYCDVPSCPAVGGKSAGWGHSAIRVADRLFGVCQINEALFRRSAAHKRHLQFTLEDVRRLDPHLADDISKDAALYGLKLRKQ